MAFLNADWPDFESTPASKENPDKSITIFDYHRLLSKTGWKTTHRIECPLSSERLSGNQVQRMQDKRILGTVGRTLLIAKNHEVGKGAKAQRGVAKLCRTLHNKAAKEPTSPIKLS